MEGSGLGLLCSNIPAVIKVVLKPRTSGRDCNTRPAEYEAAYGRLVNRCAVHTAPSGLLTVHTDDLTDCVTCRLYRELYCPHKVGLAVRYIQSQMLLVTPTFSTSSHICAL